MAVRNEYEPDGVALESARVLPDLGKKLPNLFGTAALPNTIRELIADNPVARFSGTNTHYPSDFIGLLVRTGQRFDDARLSLHSWAPGQGWTADFRATLDGAQNFSVNWQGNKQDGEDESGIMTLAWPGKIPRLRFDTRSRFVEIPHAFTRAEFDALNDPASGHRMRFLAELNRRFPVEFVNFAVTDDGLVSSILRYWDSRHPPILLRIPTLLQVRLTDGISSSASRLQGWEFR